MVDELTLIIGAIIGVVSSIITYWINHILRVREQNILRDFGIREKGREFFHQTYGIVTSLSDIVAPFANEDNVNSAMILTEKGYIVLSKEEIVKRYKESYSKYSKLWYDSREIGLEIFLNAEFVKTLSNFWAYAGYFNDNDDWEKNRDKIEEFKTISVSFCDEMDVLMGLCEKKKRIPKWLNTKNWLKIIRSEDIV